LQSGRRQEESLLLYETGFVRVWSHGKSSSRTADKMALTFKDAITTILAILTTSFSYFVVTGYKFPLISGYRTATVVLLILGIGMCALSSTNNGKGLFIVTASALGILALILTVAILIFGTKQLFLALTGTILLLWLVATIRHATGL
jgi:hypothetical protein